MEAAPTGRLCRSRTRLLERGESVIASVGLSLVALLLCVMTVTVWWTLHMQQSALDQTRAEQVTAVGEFLARSSELLLQQNEMRAVRRLIADAARLNGFSSCKIVMPDGGILASAKPSEAT